MNKIRLFACMFFVLTLTTGVNAQDGISTDQKVDLGLSVCWAGWNVGASSPEEYGDYYAWGETTTKSDYSENSYQYYKGSDFADIGCDINGTEYDVARAQWGGTWRIPTRDEHSELIDRCTWTWITYKGVNGYKITGPNGNSIFLPAAGGRFGTELSNRGSCGSYWLGSLHDCATDGAANYLVFGSSIRGVSYEGRWNGLTVRPVCDK